MKQYQADYAQGFIDKCASKGIDPEKLVLKKAEQDMWYKGNKAEEAYRAQQAKELSKPSPAPEEKAIPDSIVPKAKPVVPVKK